MLDTVVLPTARGKTREGEHGHARGAQARALERGLDKRYWYYSVRICEEVLGDMIVL